MSGKKRLSLTFKMLRTLGFNYSEEEYGDVGLLKVVGKFFRNIKLKWLEKMLDSVLLEPFEPRKLRAYFIRKMGCHVGKDVFFW